MHLRSLAPSRNSSGAVTLSTCAMGDTERKRSRSSALGRAAMRFLPSCTTTGDGDHAVGVGSIDVSCVVH